MAVTVVQNISRFLFSHHDRTARMEHERQSTPATEPYGHGFTPGDKTTGYMIPSGPFSLHHPYFVEEGPNVHTSLDWLSVAPK